MLSDIENLLFVVLLITVVLGLKEDRWRKYEETPLCEGERLPTTLLHIKRKGVNNPTHQRNATGEILNIRAHFWRALIPAPHSQGYFSVSAIYSNFNKTHSGKTSLKKRKTNG